MRFEATYYPGEDNERMPEWRVVEWTVVNVETGAKCGNCVWKTYDMENGEKDAVDMAYILQQEYDQEIYNEFG